MAIVVSKPMIYSDGRLSECGAVAEGARDKTMASKILSAHDVSGEPGRLKVKFDALTSHDITYVGIIQTARASGMEKFPMPYVLTNCHNSLCAVGGTINEDDHVFGLSAAQKYGGINVPAHMAVIHQYMREMMAAPGRMILGSDSHTRYGALGCMGVGEGGPELVKQLLGGTWDAQQPEVVAVELTGTPARGVGPQDVALHIIEAVFKNGFVKNKVMEFVGPGAEGLSVEYRMGIDVMTTETTCLSSIWATDAKVEEYLSLHGRGESYVSIQPGEGAVYDGAILVELDKVLPMIALPFHPSNALPISDFLKNPGDHVREIERAAAEMLDGRAAPPPLSGKFRSGGFYVDQGIIAGCSGGMFENLTDAADMLLGAGTGSGAFSLSVYPSSQPLMLGLSRDGALTELMEAGATIRTAFCGPCFGAGDVPSNGAFSIRHTTRNFPNREGSKPSDGQVAYVALMDARSIAATAAKGGRLTPATEFDWESREHKYTFDISPYRSRIYDGAGRPEPEQPLIFGPNIADWPEMIALPENLLMTVASAITDPVTTTDELIPSGETSSYRSNPMKLAEFTLSRKDPGYVGRAKAVHKIELARRAGAREGEVADEFARAHALGARPDSTGLGTLVFALRPGDGSAREQAASCQRVLGGCANIALEYATKRYRSNVINWGMLPFTMADAETNPLRVDDRVYIPGIRAAVESGASSVVATVLRGDESFEVTLEIPPLTDDERDILLAGSLINYSRGGK